MAIVFVLKLLYNLRAVHYNSLRLILAATIISSQCTLIVLELPPDALVDILSVLSGINCKDSRAFSLILWTAVLRHYGKNM